MSQAPTRLLISLPNDFHSDLLASVSCFAFCLMFLPCVCPAGMSRRYSDVYWEMGGPHGPFSPLTVVPVLRHSTPLTLETRSSLLCVLMNSLAL